MLKAESGSNRVFELKRATDIKHYYTRVSSPMYPVTHNELTDIHPQRDSNKPLKTCPDAYTKHTPLRVPRAEVKQVLALSVAYAFGTAQQ